MSAQRTQLGQLIEPAKPERAGERDFPVLSMTMHGGLVDQAEKFKKRVASRDTAAYRVVRRHQLVVGFPIDEGVLSFQEIYDAAIVSPAYGIWNLKEPDQIDRDYLERFLRSPRALAFYSAKLRSTTARRRSLPRETFLSMPVPLPPLSEQRRIAAILDKADAVRRKRQQTLDLADQFLRSAFLDLFGDPVTNPMGWERRTLGEMINFVGGSQPPKETFTYEPSEETVRLVQIRDFKSDRYKTYIPKALARRPFNKDDVMIARYGPPVFQILTGLSGSYNVALMKAEPIGQLEKRFVFHLLSHPSVNAAVVAQSERTAGQSGVNLQFLNNYPAYLPPPGEQHRFAAIDNSVGQQTARQRAHLAGLETLSASLQSRAFRGEL